MQEGEMQIKKGNKRSERIKRQGRQGLTKYKGGRRYKGRMEWQKVYVDM